MLIDFHTIGGHLDFVFDTLNTPTVLILYTAAKQLDRLGNGPV
jgi:hypothetical protein